MKGIYLIAFLASWTLIIASELPISYEAEDECPVPDECPPKLISHEKDCSKYYECKDSQKQLRSCRVGLYFSKKWHGCVNRKISDCHPFDGCENEGDLLPHECKCTKFYECKHGRKALRECPIDHHFNSTTNNCVPGKDCIPHLIQDPCTEGKHMPHECKCDKYYECKGGRKALRECNQGMHFDDVLLTCVPGEDCDKPPPCKNGDAKKHDCHCNKYYKCIKEDWLLEYCPNGEHFSETQKICMNPIDAGCEKPRPGDCSISSPPKWAHECDCRLYYQCENGKKKIYECIWGSYFDVANLKCDVSENVDCKNNWANL